MSDTLQRQRPLVISVAAGIDAATLQAWMGGGTPLVRCMPNTPSLVGAGAAGLYATPEVTDEQRNQASELLGAVGWSSGSMRSPCWMLSPPFPAVALPISS
ncbi:hypothetical protein Q427_33150 [Halomonas sp. BC04]|nr:hypothetical protein Q427_33150 [Halomonas sp. BC04]